MLEINFVNLLSSFAGGIIASLIAVFIWEKYRQPKLTIELHKEGPAIQTLGDGTRRAFYKLWVKNIGKSPAYYCKVFMRFFDEQGTKLVITDVISGKWDRGPEPIIYIPVPIITSSGKSEIRTVEAKQSFLIPSAEVLDIHHNVPAEAFCLLMKYEGEQEFYAFSALGYLIGQPPGHKVPEWKIGFGKNIIEIELIYSGKKSYKRRFLLENESTAVDGIKISKLK